MLDRYYAVVNFYLDKKFIGWKNKKITFVVVFLFLASISFGIPLAEGGGSPPTTTLQITILTTGGDGTFDFIVTGTSSYNPSITTIDGIGVSGPVGVSTGIYSIQEIIPTGSILTSATCNDGFSSFNIDTVSGIVIDTEDNVVCTFENTVGSQADTDGDGILNNVDTSPNTFSDDFSDIPLTGTSSGTINTRGDQTLTINEEPNPTGVRINADISGGVTPAKINVCDGASSIDIPSGKEILVTCSSVTIDVINGPVDITFISTGGVLLTTSISSDNSITFNRDTFSVLAPVTNTEMIIMDLQGTQITLNPGDNKSLLGSLQITKQTTGGDSTFNFIVTGPTTYNPSINTADGIEEVLYDSLNIFDSDYALATLHTTHIGSIIPFNGESISKITFRVSSDGLTSSSSGTIKAVIFSGVNLEDIELGDDTYTLLASSVETFQSPWDNDGAGGSFITTGYHDVIATFDPPVTVTGSDIFVGVEAINIGDAPVTLLIKDGGLTPGKICAEKVIDTNDKFFDCAYEVAMRIQSPFTDGGAGTTGSTKVESGIYSIKESIPAGWVLDSATCNDGFSSFSINTVSGITIGPGDNIMCTFENTISASADNDNDGIYNEIDPLPNTFSNDFSDIASGDTTSGTIVTRGDQTLAITDEANPQGVRIIGDNAGGLLPASINACGGLSVFTVSPGNEIVVTCSSVTIQVVNGPVDITFISSEGIQAITSLPSGNSITFDQDKFSFVTPSSNTQTIIIDVEGTPITIAPGDTNTSEPEVGTINALQDPQQVGTLVEASASFTDLGPLETHTAVFDWGDQTISAGIVSENGLSGTVTGSHIYSAPGVYTVTLTVTDDTGDSDSSIFQFIVIYDPEGGFVTGGGWIDSPTGAYVPGSTLVGKATFGFTSKYQNGVNIPTGNTQFYFQVADLKFKSTVYDWLIVAGGNVKFNGAGTINGQGNYGFQLFGFDADVNTNDNKFDDKFRIKIWDKNNGDVVVYDNNIGQSEDSEPSTIIGGGSIVIHNP